MSTQFLLPKFGGGQSLAALNTCEKVLLWTNPDISQKLENWTIKLPSRWYAVNIYVTEYSNSTDSGQPNNYIFLGGTCYVTTRGWYRAITSFDGETIIMGSPFQRGGNLGYECVLPYKVYGLKGYEME